MTQSNPRILGGIAAAVIALASGMVVQHEGSPAAAYMDRLPANPTPTACQGHTGADVVVGKIYTDEQCDRWRHDDLVAANATVRRCVGRQMPVNVEASLTDFVYNEGPGRAGVKDGFCVLKNGSHSTIRRLAMAGNWIGVCDQFQYWTSAGGKKLPGLERRRSDERKLCMTP